MSSLSKKGLFSFLLLLSLASCNRKKIITQAQSDDNAINNYLTSNKLTATKTGDGLYYIISTPGTGAQPSLSSFVTISYSGYLTNGTVFDSNKNFETQMGSVIKGWQEGIPLFKKGGAGKLLIPSALGYSATATGNIPANSVLIFDVQLLDVK